MKSSCLRPSVVLLCWLALGVVSANAQVWLLTSAPTNLYWNSIACSADGVKVFAAAHPGIIYASADSALSWTTNSAPGWHFWPSVASSEDGTKLAAGSASGFIGLSTNSGSTWEWTPKASAKLGPHGWPGSITASSDGSMLASTAGWTSTNGGTTWVAHNYYYGSICSSTDGSKLAATALIASGSSPPSTEVFRNTGGISLSTNAGVTWWETAAPKLHWNSIACSSDAGKLVAVADEGLYLSRDSGACWELAAVATDQVWNCATSSADGVKLAVAGQAGVCFSADSGATWTLSPAPDGLTHAGAVASSADGTRLYIAFNGGSCLACGGPIYKVQTEPNHR